MCYMLASYWIFLLNSCNYYWSIWWKISVMLFSPRICHDVAVLVLHGRHYSENVKLWLWSLLEVISLPILLSGIELQLSHHYSPRSTENHPDRRANSAGHGEWVGQHHSRSGLSSGRFTGPIGDASALHNHGDGCKFHSEVAEREDALGS